MFINDHNENTLKSRELLTASNYYLIQELQRVLYFSVWAKGYFISRLGKWVWNSLFNRTQTRILRSYFKEYPFPVRDYLVSLQPVLCKEHNLCSKLGKGSITSEETLNFIAGLIYTMHLINYYPTHGDGHKLTAALIVKIGIENFCNCGAIL